MTNDGVLRSVRERVQALGLSIGDAAREIGVTALSLARHLEGDYARSDSLSKYRRWLERSDNTRPSQSKRKKSETLFDSESTDSQPAPPQLTVPQRTARGKSDIDSVLPISAGNDRTYNVVDLFSGCGGMSLGFDLCALESEVAGKAGGTFETVLAFDIDQKAVELHNRNHPPRNNSSGRPARVLDLNDFINETEILAYYLDCFAAQRQDSRLANQLSSVAAISLPQLKANIAQLDREFLQQLQAIRSSSSFRKAYRAIDGRVTGQTSVIGFHEELALPPANGAVSVGPLVWAELQADAKDLAAVNPSFWNLASVVEMVDECRRSLRRQWAQALDRLEERTGSEGRGQLAASARRIRTFVDFARSTSFAPIQTAWLAWRSQRDAIRRVFALQDDLLKSLRRLYAGERMVDVVLGGPPCQGFSRIGRGKLRSLREGGVHVEADANTGDKRNRLMEQYILCVSALEPKIFLFENVRHFKAEVKTATGTFRAPELLNEAIEQLSQHHVRYGVADRIIDCSRHGIPQTRERYFLAAVRSDLGSVIPSPALADWILDLPQTPAVPLRAALAGLPSPIPVNAEGATSGGLSPTVTVDHVDSHSQGAEHDFIRWLRQPPPGTGLDTSPLSVDAHVIRPPRPDDADWFRLMGPGRRWMDYRCDDSPTLAKLDLLVACFAQAKALLKGGDGDSAPIADVLSRIDDNVISELSGAVSGSLSLRLLLECIPLRDGDVEHHLLADSYLSKSSGNNGDWIARLRADAPSRTMVSHMAKDTYQFVHPSESRTLSVREAARIQSFPDWFTFGGLGLVDGFRAVGNAVPPFLGHKLAERLIRVLALHEQAAPPKKGENAASVSHRKAKCPTPK